MASKGGGAVLGVVALKRQAREFLAKRLGLELRRTDRRRWETREQRPTETKDVEILADPDFRRTVEEVLPYTLLDTPRLANLWQLCRMANRGGATIEVGTFRGGASLLLARAAPERPLFVCDSFEGFGDLPLDPELDRLFDRERFRGTSLRDVDSLLRGQVGRYRILKGFFPDSDVLGEVQNVSFGHVDVDIYESGRRVLSALAERCGERPILVIDDYLRGADGIMRACGEFLASHKDWAAFPIYPGQGLLLHRSWFSETGPNVVGGPFQT